MGVSFVWVFISDAWIRTLTWISCLYEIAFVVIPAQLAAEAYAEIYPV